ncbi:Pkinase-domain-containing protein [Atractiella rhizophila]|nr:Pkinase-domain-containing protein [Atractiella rhizophila]
MATSSSTRKENQMLGGKYEIEEEIGKGSFATVYRGRAKNSSRSQTQTQPIAIKSVIRSKLTSKLLENLESEIEILKGISHTNIVELIDIVKTESHIYLMMFYCSMGDLSLYIPKRHANPEAQKREMSLGLGKEYPNPPDGGLNEMVVRDFCGQLTEAMKFLFSRNIIHRDIKPQNLLLHPRSLPSSPSSPQSSSSPSRPQIPYLKVADFGFARWLPSQSLAETLCGSPLYMAPEILRYEKYGASADLWSVGAVIYEMCVGRAPYRAQNHVELLRRIEKGDGTIRWPDERKEEGSSGGNGNGVKRQKTVVKEDIKELVRGLLKRNPAERMDFQVYFAMAGKIRPRSAHEVEVEREARERKENREERKAGREREFEQGAFVLPSHMRTASAPSPSPPPHVPIHLSPSPPPPTAATAVQTTLSSSPKSYNTYTRSRQPSLEYGYGKPPLISKPSSPSPPSPLNPTGRTSHSPQPSTSSSSPYAPAFATPRTTATPPPPAGVRVRDYAIAHANTNPSTRASTPQQPPSRLSSSPSSSFHPPASQPSPEDSLLLGKEYVVVEKQNVEINALADELAYGPKTLGRRNSRGFLNRQPSTSSSNNNGSQGVANYPPTPGAGVYEAAFAIPGRPTGTSPSSPSPLAYGFGTSPRGTSQREAIGNALFRPGSLDRHSSSPLALVGGPSAAIVKVINKASLKLFGASMAEGIFFSSRKRKGYRRPGPSRLVSDGNGGTGTGTGVVESDPAELTVIDELEDLAKKALVISHYADEKLATLLPPTPSVEPTSNAVAGVNAMLQRGDRRGSSSSLDRDIGLSSTVEIAAAEALILYISSLAFLQKGIEKAKSFWTTRAGQQAPSTDFNEAVQWLRSGFNECFEKAEYVKARAQDTMPESALNAEKLLYDKALEISRSAAVRELSGENPSECESEYETALWMLYACRDKTIHTSPVSVEGEDEELEDTATLDKFISSIQARLSALRKKMEKTSPSRPSA